MRPLVAHPAGGLDRADGLRPLARSGRHLVPAEAADLVPLPEGATLVHLPGRAALARDAAGDTVAVPGRVAAAAVLPVGWLRLLCPASAPERGAPRLPLFGYAAVVEHRGAPMVAALRSDDVPEWGPARLAETARVEAGLAQARADLPGNRLVDHLSVCALEHRCITARNTLERRHEGALPASPACNADCLGCISLQSDGEAPTPQPRMRYAPTAGELAGLADWHLRGEEATIVSFGQGCEGEPLTRPDALEEATREIRRRHPRATIHVNTNGSSPRALERLVAAGCNSVRISAISFRDAVFRPYYRPVGYSLDDVVRCGEVMRAAGGQVCLNLLTFPGVTDVPEEIDATVAACLRMGVTQVQWRSLNVDHDWLARVLPELPAGIGLRAARARIAERLPGVAHGNVTRPAPLPASPSHPGRA